MAIKDFLLRTLTWWNGQTWGTYFFTKRHGSFVGEDEFGNRYYRAMRPQIDPSVGPERRWVIYADQVEASQVPPGWRGWLSHTRALAPSEQNHVAHSWEKGHIPNQTGTANAYVPPGSTRALGERPPATGDYVAWMPGDSEPADVPAARAHPGTHGTDLREPYRG